MMSIGLLVASVWNALYNMRLRDGLIESFRIEFDWDDDHKGLFLMLGGAEIIGILIGVLFLKELLK